MPDEFDKWSAVKRRIDARKGVPWVKERHVVWCSVGHNVGREQNGKGRNYNRPVLVLKRYNPDLFLGLPLTSTTSGSPHHFEIEFKGQKSSVLLQHARTFDIRRVWSIMGRLPEPVFEAVKAAWLADVG